ncbi:hypothetical protein [Methylosinus sp. PW1]|uniref:hypothetical protein n=1 Tax=Methylosinus sp. PW1 TaxID=107636 RepID=UPI001FD8E901|nr:hypothetical protein [Methylosinus sp. PW1]
MSAVETKNRACRVLIIEDDQDDVFLFRRALDSVRSLLERDIECEQVDNGLDAIFLVSREEITRAVQFSILYSGRAIPVATDV